jgi:hypothetical protein
VRFSSANASLTDHSYATAKLIEVNFFGLPNPKNMVLIRFGAKSATGWANRQICLRCLGMLRRNIGCAQTLFSGAYRVNASSRKPVKFRMRLAGTLEPGANRPHPAADDGSQFSRIGGHDQNEPHWSTPNQSADRCPEY